ncbi:ABC transporter permease [Companilactobacillus sp. HBUAS56257]|uniref:ABC transporter permease n=1 Tax=Companilactobacillus sp. HBUAS56257 TaxID=3109360 RepID=UPI002FF15EA6
MANYIYQLKINFKRIILRNKAFFLFDMSLPIVFYLLYTKILPSGVSTQQLQAWNKDYLVGMMIYGCLLGSIITTANTLLNDQTSNFKIFISLKPISRFQYYSSMMVIFVTLNLIASIAISIAGILINDITLPISSIFKIILTNTIGTIPLILIGIMIAFSKRPELVNLLTNLIVFPLAIISGLWWPMEMMPKWLQTFGKLLPTYQLSIIDKAFLNHTDLNWFGFINILIWFGIFSLLLLIISKLQGHIGIAK